MVKNIMVMVCRGFAMKFFFGGTDPGLAIMEEEANLYDRSCLKTPTALH